MRNKIIIFIALFIAAVAIMTLTNDKIDLETKYDDNLLEKVDVKGDSVLSINLNNTGRFKAQQYKVKIIENTELKDSVEIYRSKLFGQYFKKYEVNVDGNNINITDIFDNLSVFCEQPFISNNMQEQYMINFPETIYKIYIPQGMEYTIE